MRYILLLILLTIPAIVFAGGVHVSDETQSYSEFNQANLQPHSPQTNIQPVPQVQQIINNYTVLNGIGLSMAESTLQFDPNENGTQLSVGAGHYWNDGANITGFAVGVGKRICQTRYHCGFLNITGGVEDGGGKGITVGYTLRL